MIRVIAIAQGFDNVALREPGDEFDVPDDVFDRRPKLDEHGQPVKDQYYDLPHWFEPVDRNLKEKVESDRKAINKGTRQSVGNVPAVDPARQQADATADARLLAAAQEAVRQERLRIDEEETRKLVDKRYQELKNRKPEAGSDPRDTRGADVKTAEAHAAKGKPSTTPSPDNLERDSDAKPSKKP